MYPYPHFNIGAEIVVLRAKVLSSSYRIKYDVLTYDAVITYPLRKGAIQKQRKLGIQEAPEHQASLKSFCFQKPWSQSGNICHKRLIMKIRDATPCQHLG